MDRLLHPLALALGLSVAILLALSPAATAGSAEPGSTVRNAFGPGPAGGSQCRGACGAGCPDSCERQLAYECLGDAQLRRVVSYVCGTHQGCREHDDCLDRCLQNEDRPGECQMQCDAGAMERHGMANSVSWLAGGGPYDGKTTFEYTRDALDALEPAFRCPPGASRQCASEVGCATADGTRVDPVFAAYPAAAADAMTISALRSGALCGDAVCAQAVDIQVSGADQCPGGRCTRFGVEFDYRNADPSVPMECASSSSGGESDFIGDLLKQGSDAMATRSGGAQKPGEDGMGQLLGMFGKVLNSADSPADVSISMAPLGEDGKPIESERIGSDPAAGPAPIPRSIELPAASGHLLVPMYQLADGLKPGAVLERRVSCRHRGSPVLEAVFRLRAGG